MDYVALAQRDHGRPGAVAFVRIGWYRCQGIDSGDKDEDYWIVTRAVLLCLLTSMKMMRFSECYNTKIPVVDAFVSANVMKRCQPAYCHQAAYVGLLQDEDHMIGFAMMVSKMSHDR